VIYTLFPALLSFAVALVFRILRVSRKENRTCLHSDFFDFFFTLVIGVLYILVLYAFTDGVFFFCTALTLLLGFFSVRKILRFCIEHLKFAKKKNQSF
jgi:hypothetical protein